jgi:N-acetylglucosamine PTS system EIICBA or EIICB component
VAGLLVSIALTSLLTGVTEPIEFSFMFLAPFLYVIHALLTGVSFIIMNALGVRLGFGFSAGLFDYVLNFNKATRPWLLFPVGAVYFALYYGVFRFAIVKLNLKTPGRDPTEAAPQVAIPATAGGRGAAYIAALGGPANLTSVDACTTRLRLVIANQDAVNTDALKALGARGFVRPSATALQVVIGANADQIAGEIRDALRSSASTVPSEPDAAKMNDLLNALGGRGNIRSIDLAASRLRIGVAQTSVIDATAIRSLGLRGVTVASSDCVHVIVGPAADVTSRALNRLLA